MTKIILLFLTLTATHFYVDAQKRGSIWAFGDSTGIDFNDPNNPVVITTSSSYDHENNASISDDQGNLQFYLGGTADTTGYTWYDEMQVFNKNGVMMENGDSILTNYSQTNGLMILPFPNDSDKYYLFALERVGYHSILRYSIVDMSFNNGLGKVVSKNVFLSTGSDSLCEKLAATKHSNGKDWWLICHQYTGFDYYEFLITAAGIIGPFTKTAGSCFCDGWGMVGEMCFSEDGTRLLNVSVEIVDVLNFDRCTGEIEAND